MKKTGFSRLRRRTGISLLALACGLPASCVKDETGSVTSLPDGRYPLRLTAEVAQLQTRSAGKDSWSGGEKIGVQLEGMSGTSTYVMDASGNAAPADAANTIYWQDTAEAEVKAWWPSELKEYDISDQSGGYAGFDFLYASATGSYDRPLNLCFRHLMAKIEVSLSAGDGVTAEDLAGAEVTFYSLNEFLFTAKSLMTMSSRWDEIKPYSSAANKYEAVVYPTNMKGKPLIRVRIDGKDFVYAPETDAAGTLAAGKRYCYTVTVKTNGIEVAAAAWSAGDEEDVAVASVVSYTADEVKAGDYLYTDGTTSDGGLRKRYPDGTAPVIADPKPQPIEGKTVAGIVFWVPKDTDPAGRTTPASLTDDKIMAADYPDCTHGLAVAVKAVTYEGSETMAWQDPYESVAAFQTGENFAPANKSDYNSIAISVDMDGVVSDNALSILGYQNTMVLKAYNAWCGDNGKEDYVVRPVDALENFAATCPAPSVTTGWFIPSLKELSMLFHKDIDGYNDNFGGIGETKSVVESSISVAGGDTFIDALYCSSTESSAGTPFCISPTVFGITVRQPGSAYNVRAVCAF